jgi:hypothetical protein
MVAVPSVLPLETGMQIEVHYVWPTQFLIDCAVRLKTAGVHLRCVGSARQRLPVQRNCGGTTKRCRNRCRLMLGFVIGAKVVASV